MFVDKITDKSISIILLTPIANNSVGVYYLNALRNLGYNNVEAVNFRKDINWHKKIDKDKVDFFILFKGYNDAKSNRQLITAIKKFDIPCVLFYPDDIHTYNLCVVLAQNFNYTFHFCKNIVDKLKEDNIKNVSHLTFGYDEKYFYPISEKKIFDVVFIGNIYGKRIELLKKINKFYDVKASDKLINNEVTKELSKAKIVFNHCIGTGLNMRFFETAACGCAMLLNEEAKSEADLLGLISDEDYIIYNEENVVEKIKYFLEDNRYEKICKNILNKIKGKSYNNVVGEMFDKIKTEIPEKRSTDRKKINIGFVTIWFNRGLSYVAKNIINVLKCDKGVNVFTYAKYGINPSDEERLIISKKSDWKIENLTYSEDCNVLQWAEWNKLNIVVFLESYYNNEILTRLKLSGIKVVLIPMCEYIDKRIIEISKSYLLDKVLSFTKFGKEILMNNGVAENKIAYVPYAIKTKEVLENQKLFIKDKEKNYILFNVGWDFTGRKNCENVIKSLIKFQKENKDIFLVFKSQDKKINLREKVFKFLDKKELCDIFIFENDFDEKDIDLLYRSVDIVVSLSKWEGLGLNLYEAMAYGLPVITCNTKPMNEITNKSGCFVDGKLLDEKVNFINKFEFDENSLFEQINDALIKTMERTKIRNRNDLSFSFFENGIFSFLKELILSKPTFPIINNKNGKIRIAHFAVFSPHLSGMYETIREMIEAENKFGYDAGMIDTSDYGIEGKEDRNIKTVAPAFANDSDLLILHSQILPPFYDSKRNMLLLLHGRPDHCFQGEISGGEATYTTLINYFENDDFKGYITLWKRHIDFWKALTKKPVYYIQPFVDLNYFKLSGNKYNFKHSGEPNVVFGDPWRLDANPYHLFHAFILFKEKYPKAKLHLFSKRKKDNEIWKKLMVRIENVGNNIFGDICQHHVGDMGEVYRAADFIVTTQVDAVRMVREPLSCGCPVVAPLGNIYTKYTANFMFPEDLCRVMEELWLNIKGDRNFEVMSARNKAEQNFDISVSMKQFDNIVKEVLS